MFPDEKSINLYAYKIIQNKVKLLIGRPYNDNMMELDEKSVNLPDPLFDWLICNL